MTLRTADGLQWGTGFEAARHGPALELRQVLASQASVSLPRRSRSIFGDPGLVSPGRGGCRLQLELPRRGLPAPAAKFAAPWKRRVRRRGSPRGAAGAKLCGSLSWASARRAARRRERAPGGGGPREGVALGDVAVQFFSWTGNRESRGALTLRLEPGRSQ